MPISESSKYGYCTLVSYIPEPLGSFFDELRRALPGEANPHAHITILPPRPLRLPVGTASEQALEVLANFPPFEVEFSTICRFPQTNILYLDIAEGSSWVHALHDALNRDGLVDTEQFEFRPHLTLGGPIPQAHLTFSQDQAEVAWHSSSHPRRFTLDEIVFLCLSPGDLQSQWHRLWSYNLRTRTTTRAKAASAVLTNRTS